jgi:hypothetical protein
VNRAPREGGQVFRGYELRQVDSAFSRYLTNSSVTALQPILQSHSEGNPSVTKGERVTDQKSLKAVPHNGCNAVTDRNKERRAGMDKGYFPSL